MLPTSERAQSSLFARLVYLLAYNGSAVAWVGKLPLPFLSDLRSASQSLSRSHIMNRIARAPAQSDLKSFRSALKSFRHESSECNVGRAVERVIRSLVMSELWAANRRESIVWSGSLRSDPSLLIRVHDTNSVERPLRLLTRWTAVSPKYRSRLHPTHWVFFLIENKSSKTEPKRETVYTI